MLTHLRHWFLPHESNNQRARLLHPTGLIVVMILWVVFQVSIEGATRIRPDILGYASQIAPEQIVELTNQRRQAEGLGVLSLNAQLSAAAAQKAADMMARDYWAHVSPVGTQPWFFITESGYSYRYAGENLARDFTNAPAIVAAWMESPSHRENLLSSKYQDIGVAIVDGNLGGHETTLVVQMFGTKLSATTATKPSVGTGSVAKPVEAKEVAAVPAVRPTEVQSASIKVNPFSLTKIAGLGLVGLFGLILIMDVLFINKLKIVRWTSKSFAHFCLMLFVLSASLLIGIGRIL